MRRVLLLMLGLASLLVAAMPAPVDADAAGARLAPARQRLQLVLPMATNGVALASFAQAVSTPGSSDYGHYRSIGWLSRHFGASAAHRRAVLSFLRRAGATDVGIDPTGMFADATLPVATAERLFSAALLVHSAATGSYLSPSVQASVPRGLRGVVTGVVGLDTRAIAAAPAALRRPRSLPEEDRSSLPEEDRSDATPSSSAYVPATGTASGCSGAIQTGAFTPAQYLGAYGLRALQAGGTQGQGQRVALVEIDGFKRGDISAFRRCFKLPKAGRIRTFPVGMRHALGPGLESTLDLEVLSAAAPRLSQIDVFETSANAAAVLKALTAPLRHDPSRLSAISVSLGLCELDDQQAVGRAGLLASNRSLEEETAAGITVLAATGDDGSSDCVRDLGGAYEPTHSLAVSYPASSPWVTAVGGTNLVLSSDNAIDYQQVWNDGGDAPGAAGGGGFSGLFTRPAYQDGVVSVNHRALPDVALLADIAPGYAIYCSASGPCVGQGEPDPWQAVGGTSAATPLLAGGLALIDQALRRHGLQSLGAVNPLLYRTARDSTLDGYVFDDVTAGSNDVSPYVYPYRKALGRYSAGHGFDEASGWGGVDVYGLARVALASQPKLLRVGITARGQNPLRTGSVRLVVSCSRACRMRAIATVRIARQPRFSVRSKIANLKRAASRVTSLDFTAGELRRLRRAAAEHRRVTAELVAVASPASRSSTTQSRTDLLVISR